MIAMIKLYKNYIDSINLIKKLQKMIQLWTIRPLVLYTNSNEKNQ